MKVKAIMEYDEEFIDFVMREANLGNADELKGYLRGIFDNTFKNEREQNGIKSITVEVSK